jgi:hypothetical protein
LEVKETISMTIQEKYLSECERESDINEHLPILKQYAEECDHITEMGVRAVVSTWAFLAAKPKKLVGYDIGKYPQVDEAIRMAGEEGILFEFHQKDVLSVEIEETDFLFIDTFHTATQLERELARHAHKARKYIGLHDTFSFWEKGEVSYVPVPENHTNCGRGLKHAIEPFLAAHPEWTVHFKTDANNGLMVLKRL